MEITFGKKDVLIPKIKEKYYDEAFYVKAFSKKLRKRPLQKVKGVTKHLSSLRLFSLSFGIIIGVFVLQFKRSDIFLYILLGIYILLFLYLSLYIIIYKNKIRKLAHKEKEMILKIDKDKVEFDDGDKTVTLNWSEIYSVIINDFTISFISKSATPEVICVPTTYKDMIIQNVYSAGQSAKITNNHEKY